MNTTTSGSVLASEALSTRLARTVKRNTWVLGLWIVLAALLLFTMFIQPDSGPAGFAALALAAWQSCE